MRKNRRYRLTMIEKEIKLETRQRGLLLGVCDVDEVSKWLILECELQMNPRRCRRR